MTSYREAGVDIAGAERHVESITDAVTSTWHGEVLGAFGGFASGVKIPKGYAEPVLMMTTDGVGTKLEIARMAGIWDGVGADLVAMCVDDLAAARATPLGFVDYMAVGALDPGRDLTIVESIAAACRLARCPLLGGETAEHPGVMAVDAVDLAGAALGVVEAGEVVEKTRVVAGDIVIGLHSPNLRSNGFSLVRSVLREALLDNVELLLQPSVIYSSSVLDAMRRTEVHAAAHVTGGGIHGNLARVVPEHLDVEIRWDSWARPDVFRLVEERGVAEPEMRSTFNLGIGFCLIAPASSLDEIYSATSEHRPTEIGRVVARA